MRNKNIIYSCVCTYIYIDIYIGYIHTIAIHYTIIQFFPDLAILIDSPWFPHPWLPQCPTATCHFAPAPRSPGPALHAPGAPEKRRPRRRTRRRRGSLPPPEISLMFRQYQIVILIGIIGIVIFNRYLIGIRKYFFVRKYCSGWNIIIWTIWNITIHLDIIIGHLY